MIRLLALLFVVMALPAAAQDLALGRRAFIQCQACHSLKAGDNKLGPTLAGVTGRKAGVVEGYAYSAPLARSGLVWDAATLDKFLTRPSAVVPGTKMVFVGMPDAARRQALIAFLKTAR